METPLIHKKRIFEYLKQGKRFDGRALDEYRKIEIKTGISNNAEGSASVKFGDTEVFAGVKMSVVEPYSDGPEEGTLTVSMELGPSASRDYEMGAPTIEAIEMGRIIDRGIRESKFIQFDKLCIKSGEKVWSVFVDIYAVNDAGNMMDAAALAALVALANAKIPVYDEKEGKATHDHTENKLPLNKEMMAFNMTLFKVDGSIIADPTKEEESLGEFRLSVAMAPNKGEPLITSMQKGRDEPISSEDMTKILKILDKVFKEIYPQILKELW